MRWLQVAGLAVAMMSLSACYSMNALNDLRKVETVKDPYAAALAKHYRDYAEAEAANYDWEASQYFAEKGLLVAYGKPFEPENPGNWRIAADKMSELENGRKTLMSALKDGLSRQFPQRAADAVFYYDCWVEEQEEGWQIEDIASCRNQFYTALGTLQEGASAPEPAPAPASAPEPVAAAEPTPAPETAPVKKQEQPSFLTTSYIVFFDYNSAALGAEADKVVSSVVADIEPLTQYEVIVNGHADRSGNANYNLDLAQKRAQAVRDALVMRGVRQDAVTVFAFGESDPRTPTSDGAKDKSNRRVEIYISQ